MLKSLIILIILIILALLVIYYSPFKGGKKYQLDKIIHERAKKARESVVIFPWQEGDDIPAKAP